MTTLNLYLKMTYTEEKTGTQSDHTGLQKRQKTDESFDFSKQQFFDVFSVQVDQIEFWSFAPCQAH